MTEYDLAIWTLRYGKYDDDGLRRVIAGGGEHGALAQRLLDQRKPATTP